ncbi:hypothetical protein BGX30_009300 [Mortierella sp. GBA39]|nr:hypothetical protein BGX30_009300 [Mortierella sp. GBA39]
MAEYFFVKTSSFISENKGKQLRYRTGLRGADGFGMKMICSGSNDPEIAKSQTCGYPDNGAEIAHIPRMDEENMRFIESKPI